MIEVGSETTEVESANREVVVSRQGGILSASALFLAQLWVWMPLANHYVIDSVQDKSSLRVRLWPLLISGSKIRRRSETSAVSILVSNDPESTTGCGSSSGERATASDRRRMWRPRRGRCVAFAGWVLPPHTLFAQAYGSLSAADGETGSRTPPVWSSTELRSRGWTGTPSRRWQAEEARPSGMRWPYASRTGRGFRRRWDTERRRRRTQSRWRRWRSYRRRSSVDWRGCGSWPDSGRRWVPPGWRCWRTCRRRARRTPPCKTLDRVPRWTANCDCTINDNSEERVELWKS